MFLNTTFTYMFLWGVVQCGTWWCVRNLLRVCDWISVSLHKHLQVNFIILKFHHIHLNIDIVFSKISPNSIENLLIDLDTDTNHSICKIRCTHYMLSDIKYQYFVIRGMDVYVCFFNIFKKWRKKLLTLNINYKFFVLMIYLVWHIIFIFM